jgi:predicted PolB exonuclease-like 3'-5' exonuclease
MNEITKFGQGGHGTGSALNRQRTVAMDIETISLSSDEKGALSAITGRIVCICLLVDDGCAIREIAIASEDERQIITEFWNAIRPTDILVGHNILAFDLAFLRQRSWILGIRPTRQIDTRKYYTTDVADTLELWTNWGNKKGASLDAIGIALGFGGKTGDGSNVDRWWTDRNFDAIRSYCRDDVRLTYHVYRRLTYQEPKPISDSGPLELPVFTRGEADSGVNCPGGKAEVTCRN